MPDKTDNDLSAEARALHNMLKTHNTAKWSIVNGLPRIEDPALRALLDHHTRLMEVVELLIIVPALTERAPGKFPYLEETNNALSRDEQAH